MGYYWRVLKIFPISVPITIEPWYKLKVKGKQTFVFEAINLGKSDWGQGIKNFRVTCGCFCKNNKKSIGSWKSNGKNLKECHPSSANNLQYILLGIYYTFLELLVLWCNEERWGAASSGSGVDGSSFSSFLIFFFLIFSLSA